MSAPEKDKDQTKSSKKTDREAKERYPNLVSHVGNALRLF
jgi:hypothetical protein